MNASLGHRDRAQANAKFTFNTKKLLTLIQTEPVDAELVRSCFDEFNKLDYKSIAGKRKIAIEDLSNELCRTVQPSESFLVQSTCKFLCNLVQSGFTLSRETCSEYLSWAQRVLASSEMQTRINILMLLKSFLIAEQFEDINLYSSCLLGVDGLFTKYLEPVDTLQLEVRYHIVGCLEGILIYNHKGNGLEEKYIHVIKNIVLNIASSILCIDYDKACCSKILSSCLHILHIIIVNKMIPNSADFTGEILGMVQVFLFHGLKDYPPVKPQVLRPAAMNLPETIHAVPKCKNLKDHKVKSKKQPNKKTAVDAKNNILPKCKGSSIYSSDSEASDTEGNNSAYADSDVRLEAVRLLQAFTENSRSRDIFGYWTQIVATGSCTDARVLTRSVLKEPTAKVKQNALSTLTQLLIDAKPFLMHAENVQRESFITFFGSVSLIIKELHFTLYSVLNLEENVDVLTHALKCLAALIHGTPYARIRPMFIIPILTECRSYIFHQDPTIQVGAFSVFDAAASCDPMMPEIYEALAVETTAKINLKMSEEVEEVDIEDVKNASVESAEKEEASGKNGISQLLHVALKNVSNNTLSMPVRLQSLKLIGRMAFNTPSLVFSNLLLVMRTLRFAICDPEPQVVLHTCRTLEIMATYLTKSNSDNRHAQIFWAFIINNIITTVKHPQTIVREAACDCLGSIGSVIFGQMLRQKNILIITVLFGAIRDEESAVRAAALRALGMLVTFQLMEEETGFLMDLADIVCSTVEDKNLGVRVKGVWAMANLCDCLIKNKDCEDAEPLPLEVILPKLYNVGVKAAKDSDKVKCNAVRALGSILYLSAEHNILKDTSLALDALINCATLENDMKVRWNACRALGVILGHYPDRVLPSSWRDQVFPALCNLICNSPNFKVRTNAAWALNSCDSYGKYTITLWKSIALAFENSQHVPSYVEYPHRDALVQQLCLTLSHVAACTKASELHNLWAEISDHVEDITNYMKQFQENILLEKIGDLIKAKSELESYAKTAKTAEDRQIAQTLANIFERTKYYNHFDKI